MVSMKLLNIISFILILDVAIALVSYDLKYEITHHNKCLVSDMIIMYFVNMSVKQCVRECAVLQSCQSISYKRKQLLCELYSVDDGTFVDNVKGTGPCVFVRKISFSPWSPSTCSCSELEACDIESSSCNKTVCPKLRLDHGVVDGNMRTLGAVVRFSCNNNYVEAQGSSSRSTCGQTGEWSYVPRCITASCSVLPVADFSAQHTNVALNKHVTLSNVFHSGALMDDGGRNPNNPNCAHTTGSLPDYATLDLGQSYTLHALYIVNRRDCCAERLRNVSISIGNSMDNMNLHVYHKDSIGATCTFVLVQPCRGRYMKIVNVDTAPLTICELEVYGN